MKVLIEIYAQIVERVQRDQAFSRTLKNSKGYSDEMRSIHEENARFLEEVLETISLDDLMSSPKDIADGVFLIIQHAISMPSFMKKMHRLLKQVSRPDPVYIAYLEDRIRSFERQPQLYGTQYDYNEQGRMTMYWCDGDIATINQRRKSIGLSSVEENEQRFIHQPQLSLNEASQYIKDQHEWLVKTGWCSEEDIKRYERRNI